MNKVVWVTSFFPPRVNVATNRNIKFLKYLPSFNWNAMVVCPKETFDPSAASRHLMSQLDNACRIAAMPRDPFLYFFDRQEKNYFYKILSRLMNNIIPPDGHIFWGLLALFCLDKEIKQFRPQIIYTTCSPFSINLIGAWLKFRYKLPWVTDFRDLWTLNPMPKKGFKRYHDKVSNSLEYFYLKYCDALIVNTKISRIRMLEKYPFLKNKIRVVSNGFDPDDIPDKNSSRVIPNSFFYGGLISRDINYTPLPILKLLSKLKLKNGFQSPFEAHYAGGEGKDFYNMCHEAGLEIKYKAHGYLAHKDFYSLIQSMTYVIMCMPQGVETRSWLPARLYDYMGNSSRIICLTPRESEIAQILEQYGNGLILFYDEPESIQLSRLKTFLFKDKNELKIDSQFTNCFSRKKLTECLCRVFLQTISG